MGDSSAMVGALKQRDLDPVVFLDAPGEVMLETLETLRDIYGSVDGYLDWIGFDSYDRRRLRDCLLVEAECEGV